MCIYNIKKPTRQSCELATIIRQCTEEVAKQIPHLRRRGTMRGISKGIIELNRLENQADILLRDAVKELFQNPHDPIEVMAWTRIYETMERVTDKEEPDEAEKLSLGFAIRADKDHIVRVERIKRNSPAYRSGVRPGDAVLAVNGQRLAALDDRTIVALLMTPQGETRLEFTRGIDPNLGTRGGSYSLTLIPSTPMEWASDESD